MGQLGDLSPQAGVAVGIVVGLLSTSIQSLGLTLQRKSHLLEDGKEVVETRRPAYRRRRWQLGMLMFVLSNLIGSTIQITTLPLPVLSTLQASGLVFNTAFATVLLKEPFTRYSLIGTILTCAGAALIATFGALSEPAHNLSQLLELLKRRRFILWMAGTLFLTALTIVFAHLLKKYSSHKHLQKHLPRSESSHNLSWSAEGLSNIKRSFTAKLPQPVQIRVSRMRVIRGLAYGLISGILSAHSLLVAKSAVELLVRTIVDHHNQFNRFESWLILLALLFFALLQLYYLHLGLRLCSTSVLYPFVFCIYNIIAIIDGLIYFHQSSRLSHLHAGLIALGTVVLLSGVLALSWRLDDTAPSDPAAPQNVPPPTPLTPGMGLVRTSEDSERSPILPKTRHRSSTTGSQQSIDEETPLLFNRRRRVPTLTIEPPTAPDTTTRDILAELDDNGSTSHDYLASLPRAPSPFLTHRRRSRGDSTSSLNITLPKSRRRSRESSSSYETEQDAIVRKGPRRSKVSRFSPTPNGEDRRRSSVPGLLMDSGSGSKAKTPDGDADAPVVAAAEEQTGPVSHSRKRSKSAVVRFVSQPLSKPSRWDAGRGAGSLG